MLFNLEIGAKSINNRANRRGVDSTCHRSAVCTGELSKRGSNRPRRFASAVNHFGNSSARRPVLVNSDVWSGLTFAGSRC